MAPPKGHKLWGNPRKPKSYTEDGFWKKAVEYFEWCEKNPWVKKEAIKTGVNAGDLVDVPVRRPYTLQGLCAYLNISLQTFHNYEKADGYHTYFEVAKAIRNIIEANQIEGATINAYNSNIVCRLLGLKDSSVVEVEDRRKTIDELFPDDDDICQDK